MCSSKEAARLTHSAMMLLLHAPPTQLVCLRCVPALHAYTVCVPLIVCPSLCASMLRASTLRAYACASTLRVSQVQRAEEL